jgi:hypothetical protein
MLTDAMIEAAINDVMSTEDCIYPGETFKEVRRRIALQALHAVAKRANAATVSAEQASTVPSGREAADPPPLGDRRPMPRIGDRISVRFGPLSHQTIIDTDGVQRFEGNGVLQYLRRTGSLDLNALAAAYRSGAFSRRDYAEFNMMLGYSVDGFRSLPEFQDLDIENPLWEDGRSTA